MSNLKKGQHVAIINCTVGGTFFVEGFATIVGEPKPIDEQQRVRFDTGYRQVVERFVDIEAQADPHEYVSLLNSRSKS